MSIEIITTEDLRKMSDKEGLILQGAEANFRIGLTVSMKC